MLLETAGRLSFILVTQWNISSRSQTNVQVTVIFLRRSYHNNIISLKTSLFLALRSIIRT